MVEVSKWVPILKSGNIVLASVESCTGGLIADRLTEVSGISQYFWGGWVVYDKSAKIELGVPQELIDRHSSVSAEVAASLAENGVQNLERILRESDPKMIELVSPRKTLVAVSTTGVAGPQSDGIHPVGLCYVGASWVSHGQTQTRTSKIIAPAGQTRLENKEYFAQKAFEFLFACLEGTP